MDLKDQIKLIADRTKHKENIKTEEATKNAFVMPFIQSLGYDIFNPLEVVPEFITDIGTKKGEKIDYAIFKDGNPTILIECKHWGQNLNVHDGQLLRYFHVSKAKFGVLTNGLEYRFYSDLVSPNIMDEKPFFVFNITDFKDSEILELKKFTKTMFDPENIVNTASDLKFKNELKELLKQELTEPTPEFVKYFAKQVYPSRVTEGVVDQFTGLIKNSIQCYFSDLINDRLKSVITVEEKNNNENLSGNTATETVVESKIITTEEELEGFMVVKTILRQQITASRITYRDAQTYFAILLDDNNRKSICRLYLNGNKKFIGLLDENKKETKIEIESLDDIFTHSVELLKIAEYYN